MKIMWHWVRWANQWNRIESLKADAGREKNFVTEQALFVGGKERLLFVLICEKSFYEKNVLYPTKINSRKMKDLLCTKGKSEHLGKYI